MKKKYIYLSLLVISVLILSAYLGLFKLLTIAVLPPHIIINENEVKWGTDKIWGTEVSYSYKCISENCYDNSVYIDINGIRESIGSVPSCAAIEGTDILAEQKNTYKYTGDPSIFSTKPSIKIVNTCEGIDVTKEIILDRFIKQVECVTVKDCSNFAYILNEVPRCSSENKCIYTDIKELEQMYLSERNEIIKNDISSNIESYKYKRYNIYLMLFMVVGLSLVVYYKFKKK